jgi:hypothetical protein
MNFMLGFSLVTEVNSNATKSIQEVNDRCIKLYGCTQ